MIDAGVASGERSSIAAHRLQSDVLLSLGGAQLGITICSIVVGKLMEPAISEVIENLINRFFEISETLLHSIGFAVALALVVLIHMVMGEMVPKNLALAGPEKTLLIPVAADVRVPAASSPSCPSSVVAIEWVAYCVAG